MLGWTEAKQQGSRAEALAANWLRERLGLVFEGVPLEMDKAGVDLAALLQVKSSTNERVCEVEIKRQPRGGLPERSGVCAQDAAPNWLFVRLWDNACFLVPLSSLLYALPAWLNAHTPVWSLARENGRSKRQVIPVPWSKIETISLPVGVRS